MKNNYVKQFFIRGLMFGGFGPVIFAIIIYIVSVTTENTNFGGGEILSGVISTYLIAYVHAGASVFNQIEEWGLCKSIGCHFGALYIVYSVCYFANRWLPTDIKMFAFFTAIFVAVYAVVWLIVYLCVKKSSRKINDKLNTK